MAQDKFTVAFSKSKEEQELFEWVKKKSIIVGLSAFTKQILYDTMIKEKREEKENY